MTTTEQLRSELTSLAEYATHVNKNGDYLQRAIGESVTRVIALIQRENRAFAKDVLTHYKEPDMYTISAVTEALIKRGLEPFTREELTKGEE